MEAAPNNRIYIDIEMFYNTTHDNCTHCIMCYLITRTQSCLSSDSAILNLATSIVSVLSIELQTKVRNHGEGSMLTNPSATSV